MRPTLLQTCATAALLFFLGPLSRAQTKPAADVQTAKPVPVPPLKLGTTNPDPQTPPARTLHDSRYGITFEVPAGWSLTRKDGEVSTFNLDARSAPAATQMRAVVNITFNPFPYSTFSSAFFYFSVTPQISDAQCHQQARAQLPRTITTTDINGVTFSHGYDQHGAICTEARDEVYTTFRNNTCYRFDLVINTFCGGDAGAGARDMTQKEMDSILQRMDNILNTVHFDK